MKNETNLSVAQLEELLAQKKQEERAQKEAERKAYEKDRNDLVFWACCEAVDQHHGLLEFKTKVMDRLRGWLERMRTYGDAKVTQENFEIMSENQDLKVVFTLQITKGFDERSKLAEEKIKQFLNEFIKKRDKRTYELISGYMERNHVTNELDIKNINRLYKMEDDFPDHPLFKEAIQLFKESYTEKKSKHYARFFKRGENNEWKPIVLDFAAL